MINKSQICVVGERKNVCYGNLGSPLMNQFDGQRMILEGIYSKSTEFGCNEPDYVEFYTRVSSYRNWLNQNMEM